jgi:hypothetical protein
VKDADGLRYGTGGAGDEKLPLGTVRIRQQSTSTPFFDDAGNYTEVAFRFLGVHSAPWMRKFTDALRICAAKRVRQTM